jgi:DNA polymerase/3'-5' exonuclease PolX
MSRNAEVERLLREIADLLELTGDSDRFKIEAYRRAARSIESLGDDLAGVAERGELESIPGVGSALRAKIREFLGTGHLAYYERLRAQVPSGLLDLMQIPGVGPKTARRLWIELRVEGPAELAEAIARGALEGFRGFGPRKIELLREGLKRLGPAPAERRMPVLAAWELAERTVAALRAAAPLDQHVVAGSLRRGRESVGDLDLLATSTNPEPIFEAFGRLPGVREIRLRGETKETVIVDPGVQIDLRVVPPESFGAALQYFTGSKDHNIHLRSIARDRGLKINEYGVFRGESPIAGRTEEEVYRALDLPWIPPELREDRGEVERAQRGELPSLVEPSGLRGELHAHLEEPDRPALVPWAAAARARGLGYLGFLLPAGTADPARERRRIAAAAARLDREPRLDVFVGLERTPSAGPDPLPDGVEYWALVPPPGSEGPPSGPPPADPPPLFLAHLPGGGSELRAAWVAYARRHALGLEITPTPGGDGLEPGEAAAAIAAGAPIYVSSRAARPDELRRLELSVRLARRGWVTDASVANARDFRTPAATGAIPPRRRR